MANVPGSAAGGVVDESASSAYYTGKAGAAIPLGGGGGVTISYKMRAQDRNVALPGFVTWISTGSPDFAGVGYPGGTPTPVGPMIPGSAIIEDEWEE